MPTETLATPPAQPSTTVTPETPAAPPPAAPAAAPAAPPSQPPAVAAAPSALDLKLPEGSLLNADDLANVTKYATTHKLSKEQASALLNDQHALAAAVMQRYAEQQQAISNGWRQEVETDKTLGGKNFMATMKYTKAVMDKFAPEGSAFRELLDTTGYGNHPEFLRFVAAIGKAIGEDSTLLRPQATAPEPPKTLAERAFPTNKT